MTTARHVDDRRRVGRLVTLVVLTASGKLKAHIVGIIALVVAKQPPIPPPAQRAR